MIEQKNDRFDEDWARGALAEEGWTLIDVDAGSCDGYFPYPGTLLIAPDGRTSFWCGETKYGNGLSIYDVYEAGQFGDTAREVILFGERDTNDPILGVLQVDS